MFGYNKPENVIEDHNCLNGKGMCFVVNNKCIAVTNGFKLCYLISVNTHVRSKSITKIQQM